MSKFLDIVNILQEYDVRHSAQGTPSVPGGGYTSTSDPNIVGNAAGLGGSFNRKFDPNIKPFADEANHRDEGAILPYPLDHNLFDRLANIKINAKEIQGLIKMSITSNTFSKPQQQILNQHHDGLKNIIDIIDSFVKDLDSLSV
jgi:hypothetical protein